MWHRPSTWRSGWACGRTPVPAAPGNGEQSLADYVKQSNLGSFTLGPTAVNALELSNVAATLASHGVWCPPNPIASITQPKRDRYGNQVIDANGAPAVQEVAFERPAVRAGRRAGLADTLANAMSADDRGAGTAAGAAGSVGWSLPLASKTGTTEAHRSSAFLGFHQQSCRGDLHLQRFADAVRTLLEPACASAADGTLYGGNEPARTWFTAMLPVANNFGPTALPPNDPELRRRGRWHSGAECGRDDRECGDQPPRGRRIPGRPGRDRKRSDRGHRGVREPGGHRDPGQHHHASTSAPVARRQPAADPRPAPPTTITVPGIGPIEIPADDPHHHEIRATCLRSRRLQPARTRVSGANSGSVRLLKSRADRGRQALAVGPAGGECGGLPHDLAHLLHRRLGAGLFGDGRIGLVRPRRRVRRRRAGSAGSER